MPAVATLTNAASVAAASLPAGTKRFILWSTAAAALRVRLGNVKAAASGEFEGIPIPAGSSTDPKYFIHTFQQPLKRAMNVNIFQSSGADISSGVGYDTLND